jgi:hypothetical protein
MFHRLLLVYGLFRTCRHPRRLPDAHGRMFIFSTIYHGKGKKSRKISINSFFLMDGSIAAGKNAENTCQTDDIPGYEKTPGQKISIHKKGGHPG